jgi:dimeric dUTPase (all-alpha-NTP-PPase superfamily)
MRVVKTITILIGRKIKMTIKTQLKEMFTMQKALNEAILKEFGEDSISEGKLMLAIVDELGELTHELKGDWCWWKKTQPPVDGQRVLEELVDIWHFVMTWELFQDARGIDFIMKKYNFYINRFGTGITGSVGYFIANVDYEFEKSPMLLDLTERLGFSFDEVYQEYLKKNKENYDRLARGY